MRSVAELVALALTAVLLGAAGAAAQPPAIEAAEIARAMQGVRADPLISPQRTFKTLQWRDQTPPKRSPMPAWMTWITGLFTWLGQSARYLVWAAAAILVMLVARYVVGVVAPHVALAADAPLVTPTHVRDLDIRPESLPENIGAAGRALWDAGQPRAALALLYRGLLSRLAHVHEVPILDSTTEGDCLALTAAHLAAERRDYASQLIGLWQRVVYGREVVESTAVHELCDRFAAAMNPAPVPPVGPGNAT